MMRLPLFVLLLFCCGGALAQPANRYDVLITEIMADPDPSMGLPNAEYIELKNVSNKPLNLQGWRLATTAARSGTFPLFILQPDSFVMVTTAAQQAALSLYGKTIAIPSFPALINSGTILSLLSAENKMVHAVAYTTEWYGSAAKAGGGYSLEMIDETAPCTGATNWAASNSLQGGTPGQKNSVAATNTDETPPALVHAFLTAPHVLTIQFSETVDSSSAVAFANYRLQPAIEIVGVKALNPLLQQVELTLAAPLDSTTLYTLTVLQVADCSGNALGARNRLPIGRPQPIEPNDIVINEILFNPKPGGNDYIELYNRSHKVLDAAQLQIANRAANGQVANARKIVSIPFYLFPGDYVVLTENAALVVRQFFVPNIDAVLPVSLPSLPDDEGNVVLLNERNTIIDDVHYKDDWHHALIADAEGVALERIDPNGPAQQKENWHSAASGAGYGTPTYRNSQYGQSFTKGFLNVLPKTFSPDGDGYDDVALIHYAMAESGFVANVTIFDAAGRPVRRLAKNHLLARQGRWQWDGLNDRGQRLPIGTYIVVVEAFNTKGEKQQFKTTVVLARRL